jgi:hypothetical protein
MASNSSCSEPISSSDLATTRLLASPASTCGRPVLTCSPPRRWARVRVAAVAPSRCPSSPAWPGGMLAVCTPTSQEAALTGSPPGPSTAGLTSIGP